MMAEAPPENTNRKEAAPGSSEVPSPASGHPEPEETAHLAYQDWQQRGSPIGTPEEDWFHAEKEIKQHTNDTSKAKTDTGKSSEPCGKAASLTHGRYFKPLVIALLIVVIVAGVYIAWLIFRPKGLGKGFASGNGRIEAVDFDVAAKSPGRISEMFANDGDFVTAGQVVVKMDVDVLQAQLQQAKAQEAEARNAVETALAIVNQRESERAAALAVVTHREAEQVVAEKTAQRSLVLSTQHAASVQEYEDDVARQKETTAAVLSAKAQVVAAQATIIATRSQVLEARSRVDAAIAAENRLRVDIADGELKAARDGRVQFRIAQPGEVVAAGGKVLSMIDLSDVTMTFFLPEATAGRVAIGSEVHIVLDAAPQYVIPATVSFVANVAQFTPKTVETTSEREKLVFRIKARIDPVLLRKHVAQVKSGLPGMAYVRLDPSAPWPEKLKTRIEQ
jgi:HlyD family secretion protein